MVIVNSLLILALLLATNQSLALQNNDKGLIVEEFSEDYRLPKDVVPIHYDIKLVPHIVVNHFTNDGETSIDIEVRNWTATIALHITRLTINESLTRLIRKNKDDINVVSNYVPKEHSYNEYTQIMTIQFDEPLDPGIYNLYLKFEGVIGNNVHGFYRSFYIDNDGNKVWLAITHFQPTSARQAFPCWDEPAIKATFKFSIKHYPNYTALSNMPSIQSDVDAVDGKIWTYFETTPIMSTNVVGFVIADYGYISNANGTIRIWVPKKLLPFAAYPLDIAEKAMLELEKFTNSTARVPKMDHISVPHYSSRATENWGMIVYRENALLQDENKHPVLAKMYNTMTIAHELAHQWFGNLVSPIWWKYLWLSEGMSNYLKFYITDKLFKEWRLMDFYVVDHVQSILTTDSHEWTKPINLNITGHLDVYSAYSPITYTKSAAVLHMISHFLSEDVFRNGLIKYLQAHEYSSATPDDLWKALQDALDESNIPHNDFKIKEVMDTWIEQPGYPLVTVIRNYTTGEIKATQTIFRCPKSNNTERNVTWWIPLNFATQSNLVFSSTLATHWLKPEDESIIIKGVDINDWIIVNKHQTGYYRVNYDITNWKRIAAFLNNEDYTKIPVLNRAQIINDAFYMIMSEELDPITFLEIINYLSREIDPIVWQPVHRIIQSLGIFLQIPDSSAIFRQYIFNLSYNLLQRIGFDEHPNDDHLTIQTRFKLGAYACMYGHPECQANATSKLLAYMEDPIANKISPEQEWIYCNGLMKANESIWNQFLQTQKKISTYHLKYLGCSENADIIKKHLNLAKEEDSMYSFDYYYSQIFSNLLRNPSTVDMAIDFFINNSDQIVSHVQSSVHILLDIIQGSVKQEQIEKIKSFVERHEVYINNEITNREQYLSKMKNIVSRIRMAIKNNEFSVPMHFTINNDI